MLGLLILLFTIVPAIEIYLLIKVGSAIGGLNTILIVIATGVIGAALAKGQGLSILNKIQQKLYDGKLPTDQIVHGLLVFGGGLLLLTPGILTDILGLSMVIPGSRFFWVGLSKKWFKHAIKSGNITVVQGYNFGGGGFQGSSDPFNEKPHTLDKDTFDADYKKRD